MSIWRRLQHLFRKRSTLWVSNVSEHTPPHVMSESQTQLWIRWVKAKHSFGSEMPVRNVSQKFIRPQWGEILKELWSKPATNADFRSSFWQIHHVSNVRLLEHKIQNWGMYLFTNSYGIYVVDQRRGDGWISGWSEIFTFYTRNSKTRFWDIWRENCFSTEQNHP